jgi:DNA replication protein DnaC
LKKLPADPAQLHNVPDLPPNFLPRDTDLAVLKAEVLAGSQQSVGITSITSAPALQHAATPPQRAGLHGMGGIGKTVLAAALAHDTAVRAAFPDGIFWLTISQTPDLLSRQHQLAQALTGQAQILRDFLEW